MVEIVWVLTENGAGFVIHRHMDRLDGLCGAFAAQYLATFFIVLIGVCDHLTQSIFRHFVRQFEEARTRSVVLRRLCKRDNLNKT